MIIYDCEIIKAIQGKNEPLRKGIHYCEGWRDFKGMGISVICAYDYSEDRYRVFCADNFHEFQNLVNGTDIVVGFNSIGFDNPLCYANAINVSDEKSYDILVEVWVGAGLGPMFEYPSHIGFGLDAICKENFGIEKTGHGALAPVDWQKGNIGAVIDYCINDVKLTKRLLDHIIQVGYIKNPKDPSSVLNIRRPNANHNPS
ncbi:MAG: hypothetical protein ABIJ57_17230, partial [Pseudomonadota bacterium]